jgi:uncharacterized phage-associated protein
MYNQKIKRFTFDPEKALEVILFISKKSPDLYHLLKILYFADKKHLSEYGRLICGDSYVAMQNGPVPSQTYDIIKSVRGDQTLNNAEPFKDSFKVENNKVIPSRKPDLDKLSESDIECLENSIKENKNLSFQTLKEKSHDKAFESADENDFISIIQLANSLENKEEVLKYLETMYD